MSAINRTSKLKIRLFVIISLLIIPTVLIIRNCSAASLYSSKTSLTSEKSTQDGILDIFSDKQKNNVPKNATFAPLIISDYIYMPANGSISSDFGFRTHPVTGEPDFHTGIDIAAPKGKPIYAALSGKVKKVGSSQINGNYIEIEHKQGLTTLYCHCDKIIAKEGAVIKKGERIAKIGSTGITTGPHLHFEVKVNSISYNPHWIINSKQNMLLTG